jgi:hypothetical protein
MRLTPLLLLAACNGDKNALPEKIAGVWEVHQVETGKGEIDGLAAVLAAYPGCVWGRTTWDFTDDHVEVSTDVLCPASVTNDEFYGCSVTAKVPAAWDVKGGSWTVSEASTATSRTVGTGDGAMQTPTACRVTVEAGDYPVARVHGQKWRWEMRTPAGNVYRLSQPESDRPDFVAALQRREAEKSGTGAAPAAAPTNVEPK